MTASVYIHIPFCKSKCAYCDFASWAGRLDMAQAYVDAVCREAEAFAREYGVLHVPTVYIGGGTPSLLPAGQIARLLDTVRRVFVVERDAEISMEANPGTVDSLRGYRQAGVNRLSLGVQSSLDRLLRSVGRIHTRQQAEEAFQEARRAGFDNINLDLMYGLPGQSEPDFLRSVEWAIHLRPEHLSLYSLILEEGTPLYESGVQVPGEEETLSMQRSAIRQLGGAGYERYEISNYALPGRECRHNLVYWRRGDYLGLGCAAHSLMRGERFAHSRNLDAYLRGETLEREKLTAEDVRLETLMLGLRTREGIPASAVDAGEAAKLGEFLRLSGGRVCLTSRGTEVMDEVVRRLL